MIISESSLHILVCTDFNLPVLYELCKFSVSRTCLGCKVDVITYNSPTVNVTSGPLRLATPTIDRTSQCNMSKSEVSIIKIRGFPGTDTTQFKRTVSKLSHHAPHPDPIDDLAGSIDTPAPKLHSAGEVLFKCGVVCRDYEYEMVILHANKVTGELSLPQGACKWIAKSEGSMPGLESFDATAERIANYQLGFKSTLVRYNPEESLQPYVVKTGDPLRMKTPFAFESEAPAGNMLEVTAWFLAAFDSEGLTQMSCNTRLRAADRGEEWRVCVFETGDALRIVSDRERAVLMKAIEARDYNLDSGD